MGRTGQGINSVSFNVLARKNMYILLTLILQLSRNLKTLFLKLLTFKATCLLLPVPYTV